MFKLMIVGRRRGGMLLEQLHRYMHDVHGATVLRFIAERPELTPRRYVQNHVHDGSFRVPGELPDPFALGRDFVTELWFDSPAAAAAATQAPFYLEHLRPDEDRFVDQRSVVKLPVDEQAQFDAGRGLSGSKLFVFHRRAADVGDEDLAAATMRQWQSLLAGSDHGIERLVRNRVRTAPAQASTAADLVDAAWLEDGEAARRVAARWLAWADEAPLRANSAPGSLFVLLAREHVLHAGAAGRQREVSRI